MASEGAGGIPDDVLLSRVREGDPDAFQALFDRHLAAMRGRVLRILPARVRRKVSVDDVIQEARIAAHRGQGEFETRSDGTFRGWLVKIAENQALTALRRHDGAARRSARREVSRDGRPDTEAVEARDPSPSEHAMSREVRDAVHAALDQLPEDYSTVLRLARLEGRSLAEVGERMGRSREAAKKLYGRALNRLAEVLLREGLGRPDARG